MPSTSPSVREHFENPEVVATSESTARSGLWDVESRALGATARAAADDGEADVTQDAGGRGAVLVDLGCGAGRSSIALATDFEEDALLDTASRDGSFVHWFTPDSLADELRAATDASVDLKVSEDGLRAAALLSGAASASVGGTD